MGDYMWFYLVLPVLLLSGGFCNTWSMFQVPSATEMARKKGLSSRVGPKFSPNWEFAKVQTWLRCGDGWFIPIRLETYLFEFEFKSRQEQKG